MLLTTTESNPASKQEEFSALMAPGARSPQSSDDVKRSRSAAALEVNKSNSGPLKPADGDKESILENSMKQQRSPVKSALTKSEMIYDYQRQ